MSSKTINLNTTSSVTRGLKAADQSNRRRKAALASSTGLTRPPRNDLLPNLTIVNLPVDALKTPARALRKHDAARVRELAASIGALGFCVPVLVGDGDTVIDGVARVEAAKLMGVGVIPCIRIAHLSPDEVRVLRIAINRLAEKGEWDLDELRLEVEELTLVEAPIDQATEEAMTLERIMSEALKRDKRWSPADDHDDGGEPDRGD